MNKNIAKETNKEIDSAFKIALRLINAVERNDVKNAAMFARALKIVIAQLYNSQKINITR